MKPQNSQLLTGLALTLAPATAAFAGDADVRVHAPARGGEVELRISLGSGGETVRPVPITWRPGMTAEDKMFQIVNFLRDQNPPWNVDPLSYSADEAYVVFHDFHPGTTITIGPGTTGEAEDSATAAAVTSSAVEFDGPFDPFAQPGQPAIFTAGLVSDVGRLSVQISAQELGFQTHGPIICQALFQRLAPHAAQYGAQIVYAGDRLEITFDPAYTLTRGGVIFGTTSPSTGCRGSIVMPNAPPTCPQDIDGDGMVGLGDLALVLAAFGSSSGDPAFNPDADLDQDGNVGLSDLAQILAAFGSRCP
jgi:hypothetical protein